MNRLISGIKNNNNLFKSQQILKSYNSTDWKKFVNFDNDNYKKNLVYRDDKFEVFVVCWLPKQETKIHNHSKNGCILKILEGNMQEIMYDNKIYDENNFKILSKNTIIKDDVRYIDDNLGFHKMINNNYKTVSLHIYSPPNFIPSILK